MTHLVGTIAARTRRIIHDISIAFADSEELIHVFPACLSCWGVEVVQLRRGTNDGPIMELSDDHTTDKTSEWIKLEEPGAPEGWHLWVGDGHAAEEGKSNHQEGIEESADDCDLC
jgi:hypothetical protein